MPYPKYETIIAKGRPLFSRASYVVVLCLRDRHGQQCIHHAETFFGHDGRVVRGQALTMARAAREGRYRIIGYRSDYVPVGFIAPEGGWPYASPFMRA